MPGEPVPRDLNNLNITLVRTFEYEGMFKIFRILQEHISEHSAPNAVMAHRKDYIFRKENKMIHVLFNPKACSGNGETKAKEVAKFYENEEISYTDTTNIENYDETINSIPKSDTIVIAGGDGTLNYLINHVEENTLRNRQIDYFPAGTGNDFASELKCKAGELIKDISRYLVDLPTVEVKGKTYKFMNGVGYGIDGYCCEVGDKLRLESDKPVNYTAIAIKGLLFHFKPLTAKVTIDGKTKTFEKAWLTPVMNGKMYGGGMIPTPDQERLTPKEDKKLSVLTYCTKSALKALMVFPSIFKGEHLLKKDVCGIHTGRDIKIEFSRPCACQIDGETITDVTEIHARV